MPNHVQCRFVSSYACLRERHDGLGAVWIAFVFQGHEVVANQLDDLFRETVHLRSWSEGDPDDRRRGGMRGTRSAQLPRILKGGSDHSEGR